MTPTVAVIPAAGRGTRMRPATRAVPKAFLPLIDRPAIQYAVQEAAEAGATEIFAVVDADVVDLVDVHFGDPLPGLEAVVVRAVVQANPLGLGDAVLSAAEAVGDRPFMCLLVDELMKPGREVLGRLSDVAGPESAVALRTVVDPSQLSRYGVVVVDGPPTEGSYGIIGAVEKPDRGSAPSTLALVGRYVFAPEIFDALSGLEPGYNDEIQLTDAINRIGGRLRGVVADDAVLDIGNPLGLAKATHLLAASHHDWGPEYVRFVTNGV